MVPVVLGVRTLVGMVVVGVLVGVVLALVLVSSGCGQLLVAA